MSARKKTAKKKKTPRLSKLGPLKNNYRVWEHGEERPNKPNINADDPEMAAMFMFETPGWGDYADLMAEGADGVQHRFKLRHGETECTRVR